MSQKVSMKDISDACGVSIATVSKALNDRGDISDETKQKIRFIAADMGYFPNAAAKALKTSRSYNLGVLFVDDAMSGLTHDYFAHVLDSFKRTAEASGYDITFINSQAQGEQPRSYLEHVQYRGFDGVVIACVNFYDPKVEELIRGNIPVVTIDHVFDNRIAIMSNNIKGMKDLVTYCISQGHRKIAYVHGAYSSVTQSRLSSFYKTCESFGIDVPEEYVLEGDYRNTSKAFACTEQLLKLKDPPTCILYPDDFAAIGGIGAIHMMGLQPGIDVSVAGFDGIPIAMRMHPPLTTLHQDTETLGRLAAQRLISLIDSPRTTVIEQVTVDGQIFPGGTVGKIN